MATELRKTGINVVGDIPWGAHFCHFYETKADLLDILLPYFKMGLENNEFCMWVIFDPLNEDDARDALRGAIPDADQLLTAGAIKIRSHSQRYLKNGVLDTQRVINGWKQQLTQALQSGYDGMRVNSNGAWLTEKDWDDFLRYEHALNHLLLDRKMIVLCTYPLALSRAADLFDVARSHDMAIARRHGHWEILETPKLKQDKAEIKQHNEELEDLVVERTEALAATTEELGGEIVERKRAEAEGTRLFEQVRVGREELRILSRRLLQAYEAERHAIARELHDEIGQLLTGVSLLLTANQLLSLDQAQARMAEAQVHVRDLIEIVRNLALNLRPAMLDDLGLVPALVWLFERYTTQTQVAVRFEHMGLEEQRFASEVETTAYRIIQEALTNVARHAGVSSVTVRLWVDLDSLYVVIADQGRGFESQTLQPYNSTGLAGMYERTALLGGFMTLDSALGAGTRITAALPFDAAEPSNQEHEA